MYLTLVTLLVLVVVVGRREATIKGLTIEWVW